MNDLPRRAVVTVFCALYLFLGPRLMGLLSVIIVVSCLARGAAAHYERATRACAP